MALLAVFLLPDVFFIFLHVLDLVSPEIKHPAWSLEMDGGYAEFYQYLKWCALTFLTARLVWVHGFSAFFFWSLVFLYCLLDDVLGVHEVFGHELVKMLGAEQWLGLRIQDIGELMLWVLMGILILLPIAWQYFRANDAFRVFTRDMFALLMALGFFGAFVDFVHGSFDLGAYLNAFLAIIEDGGEMLMASVMLWYVLLQNFAKEKISLALLCKSLAGDGKRE